MSALAVAGPVLFRAIPPPVLAPAKSAKANESYGGKMKRITILDKWKQPKIVKTKRAVWFEDEQAAPPKITSAFIEHQTKLYLEEGGTITKLKSHLKDE
jgi:hypothetical protein